MFRRRRPYGVRLLPGPSFSRRRDETETARVTSVAFPACPHFQPQVLGVSRVAAELEGDKVALLVVRRRLVLEFQGRELLDLQRVRRLRSTAGASFRRRDPAAAQHQRGGIRTRIQVLAAADGALPYDTPPRSPSASVRSLLSRPPAPPPRPSGRRTRRGMHTGMMRCFTPRSRRRRQ